MLVRQRSREAALEREELIDVEEWAQAHGVRSPLLVPAVVTRELWDLLETLPLREIGHTTVETRVLDVLERAERALSGQWAISGDDRDSMTVSFGAPLPSRSDAPRWRPLALRCAIDERGELEITIGFPHELKSLALAVRER